MDFADRVFAAAGITVEEEPSANHQVRDRGPKLEFLTYVEVRARVRARGPRRYLLRGIWPAGAYGVHGAEMKAQKSWNAIDLAVSVASGTDWLGHVPIDDPGPVLIFWGEGDDAELVRRIDAVAIARGLDPDELDITICTRVPHLGNAEHLEMLTDQVTTQEPKLVILDPLYLAARGANSRDLYEMGQFLEPVQHICQDMEAALIVVTHFNRKPGRGALRITGAGPAEWGRVIIGATVRGRHTDATTRETSVVSDLDIIGGAIADRRLRVHRRIRADDPDDLDSTLHYHVEVTETEYSTTDDDGTRLAPADRKVVEALRATASPAAGRTVEQLGDWIAKRYPPGLKRPTISKALNLLAELGRADGAAAAGKGVFQPKVWWPLEEED